MMLKLLGFFFFNTYINTHIFTKARLNGNYCTDFIFYISYTSVSVLTEIALSLLAESYFIIMLYHNLCNLFLIIIHVHVYIIHTHYCTHTIYVFFSVSNDATVKIFVLVTLSRCLRILAEVKLLGQRTFSLKMSLDVNNLLFLNVWTNL